MSCAWFWVGWVYGWGRAGAVRADCYQR